MNMSKLFLGLLGTIVICGQSHAMDTLPMRSELYAAIFYGNAEHVKDLIEKTIAFNPNHKYAARVYRTDAGRHVPKEASGPHSVSGGGNMPECEVVFIPLVLACRQGQLAVVRLMVEEYSADIVHSGDYSEVLKETLFSEKSCPDVVQYLVSKGAIQDPEWIRIIEGWLQNPANKNDAQYGKMQRIVYLLRGTKIVAGVPLTRMNMGIIAVVCAVGLAVGKCLYDRHYKNKKKNKADVDEADDAQVQQEVV